MEHTWRGDEGGEVVNPLRGDDRFDQSPKPGRGNVLPLPSYKLCRKFVFEMLKIYSSKPPHQKREAKYLMGNEALVVGMALRMSSKSRRAHWIGTTELFWKLGDSPVTSPKCNKILERLLISSFTGAMKIDASST